MLIYENPEFLYLNPVTGFDRMHLSKAQQADPEKLLTLNNSYKK